MNWYNRKSVNFLTPPSSVSRAVTLAEMKAYLRVSDTTDDLMIGMFIDTATQAVRNFTRRGILKETLELFIDSPSHGDDAIVGLGQGTHTISRGYLTGFPNEIDLPFPPVISIDSITTYAQDNTGSVYLSTKYTVDATSGRVYLNEGHSWPSNLRDRQAMKITYKVGHEAGDIPSPIKTAIMMHVAYMYECREACELPPNCQGLLSPYCILDLMGFV